MVLIIALLGILSVVAVIKWPSGLKEEAAAKEFKRAVRYAQHKAMSRSFSGAAGAWGLAIAANRYTIKRADNSESAEQDYTNRLLLNDSAFTLTGPDIWFNGLGEPIKTSGALLSATDPRTFTINGTKQLTLCPETGFVRGGATCP